MFAAPNLTEKDEILFILSPFTSGTSFIKAITTPNIAKYTVKRTLSGNILQALITEGILSPKTCTFAWRKKPIFTKVPLTIKMQNAARSGYLLSLNGGIEYRVPKIQEPVTTACKGHAAFRTR